LYLLLVDEADKLYQVNFTEDILVYESEIALGFNALDEAAKYLSTEVAFKLFS
jgi:hypothetical protein